MDEIQALPENLGHDLAIAIVQALGGLELLQHILA